MKILKPQAGAVLDGPRIEVALELRGGRIVQRASRSLAPDTGHIHLWLDGRIVSMTFALQDTIEVKPGKHLLQAEFVAADHGPFNPRVLDAVTFEVR